MHEFGRFSSGIGCCARPSDSLCFSPFCAIRVQWSALSRAPIMTCAARTYRGPQIQRDLRKFCGARCVQAITISDALLLCIEQEIESLFWPVLDHDRLASEKSKAVGSQQKRQRLCFRPHTCPPTRLGSRIDGDAPMSRLGKRVVLLRLFYGGEMQKCDSLSHRLFFHPIHRNHVAPILFKKLDEQRPPTPPSPPAPRPPLCFGLRVVQNPRSPSLCSLCGSRILNSVVGPGRAELKAASAVGVSLS